MSVGTTARFITGTSLLGLGYAWTEARLFTVRQVPVPVLPSGAAPLRVLHISDLHVTPYQHRKLAWIRSLGELDVDLVVCTGDILAHRDSVPVVLAALSPLLSKPGVFVLGSNDYFEPQLKNPLRYFAGPSNRHPIAGNPLPTLDLVQGFTDAGWLNLTNARVSSQATGRELEFVGVDDPHLHRDRYDHVSGPPSVGAHLTIGVAHAPYRRVLDAMASDSIRLIMAGHTHGGQLRVPGYGALVTNCDLPREQARGLSRWHDAWLHVSAGAGTSPYTAVRFFCRPEATVLTLTAA